MECLNYMQNHTKINNFSGYIMLSVIINLLFPAFLLSHFFPVYIFPWKSWAIFFSFLSAIKWVRNDEIMLSRILNLLLLSPCEEIQDKGDTQLSQLFLLSAAPGLPNSIIKP